VQCLAGATVAELACDKNYKGAVRTFVVFVFSKKAYFEPSIALSDAAQKQFYLFFAQNAAIPRLKPGARH
jgi:hypothetical protein